MIEKISKNEVRIPTYEDDYISLTDGSTQPLMQLSQERYLYDGAIRQIGKDLIKAADELKANTLWSGPEEEEASIVVDLDEITVNGVTYQRKAV